MTRSSQGIEPPSNPGRFSVLVTIYSQHPNRGKVQILATYQGEAGIISSTVTSIADATLAAPIVDALNRISALATMPVSVYDTRYGPVGDYPQKHLAAVVDRSARAELLNGAHSLWYEHVNLLLHQALTDLDDAVAAVPAPVCTAIDAELETEVGQLRAALAEYSEAIPPPEAESPRHWDFGSPFVLFDGGLDDLSHDCRERLDQLEKGISPGQREQAVADLRLLGTAYGQYVGGQAMLDPANFAIFHEPFDSDEYYLSVDAPRPDGDGHGSWRIEIGHWEPDDPADEECDSATGQTLLVCTCPSPPDASEIAALLNHSERQPEQLSEWAKTPIGATLAGTTFVVTERPDA
jgi:hypothetical protein